MTRLKQIVLVRHGDTVGESRIRFHGANDVALSEPGRAQARAARAHVPIQEVDWIIASPKKRAWETANVVPGPPRKRCANAWRWAEWVDVEIAVASLEPNG